MSIWNSKSTVGKRKTEAKPITIYCKTQTILDFACLSHSYSSCECRVSIRSFLNFWQAVVACLSKHRVRNRLVCLLYADQSNIHVEFANSVCVTFEDLVVVLKGWRTISMFWLYMWMLQNVARNVEMLRSILVSLLLWRSWFKKHAAVYITDVFDLYMARWSEKLQCWIVFFWGDRIMLSHNDTVSSKIGMKRNVLLWPKCLTVAQ